MTHTEDISTLAAALIEAQKAFKPAIKESSNPAFKSKYVDLAGVIDATREALNANGLCIIQGATGSPETATVSVYTRLLHKSGQWLEEMITLPAVGRDGATAQSFGSATTYARRYGYMALVGIAPEDDDANAASGAMPVSAANISAEKTATWRKMIAEAETAQEFTSLAKVAKTEPADIRGMLHNAATSHGLVWDAEKGKYVPKIREQLAASLKEEG